MPLSAENLIARQNMINKIYHIERIIAEDSDKKFSDLPLKAKQDLMKKDLPKSIIFTTIEQVAFEYFCGFKSENTGYFFTEKPKITMTTELVWIKW